jgi:hypothetical protein
LALAEGESVHGRVLQLERARRTEQGGQNSLLTFLTLSTGVALMALSVRLALGGGGLVGVLKQLRALRRRGTTGQGQGQARGDNRPRFVVHPPELGEGMVSTSMDTPPLLHPPDGGDRDGIEWT